MSLSSTVLFEELETQNERYAVHVKYNGRWMLATHLDSLQDAELVAEAAHRRSALPVEIRTLDRTLVAAFEPPATSAQDTASY